MKKYIVMIVITITSCGESFFGVNKCKDDCSNKFSDCAFVATKASVDQTTNAVIPALQSQFVAACLYLNEQCFNSCEKKHPAIF